MTPETIELRPGFAISRIAKGNWQIADDHSGHVPPLDEIVADLFAFAESGITTFVCGDIYVGVEARIGEFLRRYRARYGAQAARRIKVLTTYAPFFLDEERLRRHSLADCEHIIDRSLQRLGLERLDLVQMHWWNYEIPGCVEMALMLKELQAKGKIDLIGATNFDTAHMRKMFAAGVDIASHTVQYSVLDRRPEHGMVELCAANDCHLLGYGALGGGLISEKWLGIADPGGPHLENVSLDKYYRIVQDFGGWPLFQELLRALAAIAARHGVKIGNVAARYVLDRKHVACAIVGARDRAHLAANLQTFSFDLDARDNAEIAAILARSKGPTGDCYELDRNENRDALEEVKTTYLDVENGTLVRKNRPKVTVAEPYGHYLTQK
ncbi:MAG TPA: aldo/keto reductase [Steroidobacteraceae bacterium]|nr:aldo/keto reductase [Steroidobacteraceae bacterium]